MIEFLIANRDPCSDDCQSHFWLNDETKELFQFGRWEENKLEWRSLSKEWLRGLND